MKPTEESGSSIEEVTAGSPSGSVKLTVQEVLTDLRSGMRTKGFLVKYGITIAEFESLLKMLIRKGLFSKDEFKTWKSSRPAPVEKSKSSASNTPKSLGSGDSGAGHHIQTFVLSDPEKNHAWALPLFTTKRELLNGATFKATLQGTKYLFVVENLIFRGSVFILEDAGESKTPKSKSEAAIELISKHGWAAYLEQRAIEANLSEKGKIRSHRKARLILLHCQRDTYLAALHTPRPAINLYVGASLEKLKERLARVVDVSEIGIFNQ